MSDLGSVWPSGAITGPRRSVRGRAWWTVAHRIGPVLALLLVLACSVPAHPLAPVPAASPTAIPPVEFPRDAAAHDNLTEWWYYTGHLSTADHAHQYGFEYTVFQLRRQDEPTAYMTHFAVTDVTNQTFSHQAHLVTGAFQPGFNLDVGGWRLWNDGTADQIDASMTDGPGAQPAFGLQLALTDQKPPVLHNGGYIDYGPAGGSYYYSRTRLAAKGQVALLGGQSLAVTGQAWMDHQWGNFVLASTGGWDWFSLQLNDFSEIMLYVLRAPDGSGSGVYGTQVLPDGTAHEITPNTVREMAVGTWDSPHTGAHYPSGWQLDLPDQVLSLTVTPLVKDQELYFPGFDAGGLAYWEGAVGVQGQTGSPDGTGYVELTGYAPARAFAVPGSTPTGPG